MFWFVGLIVLAVLGIVVMGSPYLTQNADAAFSAPVATSTVVTDANGFPTGKTEFAGIFCTAGETKEVKVGLYAKYGERYENGTIKMWLDTKFDGEFITYIEIPTQDPDRVEYDGVLFVNEGCVSAWK